MINKPGTLNKKAIAAEFIFIHSFDIIMILDHFLTFSGSDQKLDRIQVLSQQIKYHQKWGQKEKHIP